MHLYQVHEKDIDTGEILVEGRVLKCDQKYSKEEFDRMVAESDACIIEEAEKYLVNNYGFNFIDCVISRLE